MMVDINYVYENRTEDARTSHETGVQIIMCKIFEKHVDNYD